MFHCLNRDFRMIYMIAVIKNHVNHNNHKEVIVQKRCRKTPRLLKYLHLYKNSAYYNKDENEF